MSGLQWRRFNFFEFSKDVTGGNIAELLEDSVVTCTTSGRGHLILGDSSGFLHILGRNDLSPSTLRVFDLSVLHVIQLRRQSGILVLVGLDVHPSEPGSSAHFLKVYNTDRSDPQTGHPLLLRSSRISTSSVVSAFAVHENQNLLVLGFVDGTLQLWRGDISRTRGVRIKNITLGSTPLTGLALRTGAVGTFLYASTQNDVYNFNITSKDKEVKAHLDPLGCRKGLAINVDMNSDTHFVVGTKDAVYCYNYECCTHCYAFQGEKSYLYWFRNYLVIVSSVEGEGQSVVLSIFDVQNKFIAYSGEVPKISALFSEWGNLYLLSESNIFVLKEKDTQSKLNILFKENFYDIAIKMAKNQRYDADGLIDIFRQYGDHLYVRGDYSGAIDNYCKTIGRLEPSYVIRRFLDAQRIENLTVYLQALHRREAANEDHTTLLLNCYTKLKDEEKLSDFIMTKDREVDFDVDVAVKVCRQAGYFDHALALAKKHSKYEWVLKIQLEDRKNYASAADYISGLDAIAMENSLRKYGSALVAVLPEQTTEMALRSCRSGGVPPEEYITLFIRNPEQMVNYLEKIVECEWDDELSSQIYNTLLECYLSKLPDNETKVLNLLRTGNCNVDQALILCKNASCKPGLLYLYEKKRIYEEILLFHVKEGDLQAALETCRKFGDEDRQLWSSALRLIPCQPSATPAIMSEVLESIESLKLLSPLEVINSLTSTPGATLGLVREYLLRFMESEEEILEENGRAISDYQVETEKIKGKIHALENEPLIFQCSKCSACSNPLDLPSVHFLCKHSFHKQCAVSFAESENECPVCYKENKRLLDIVTAQESNKTAHEAFHYQLETASDGFSLVAQYFGRGLFRGDGDDLLSIINEAAKNMSSDKSFMGSLSTNNSNTGLQSESRIRMEEGNTRGVGSTTSEARLRVDQGSSSGGLSLLSESRLRSQMPVSIAPSISDARLRLNEGSKAASSSISSTTSKMASSSSSRAKAPPINEKEKEGPNPFEHEDSPLDENNPFYEEVDAKGDDNSGKNPFGEDGEENGENYDESLNPFS